MKVNAPTIKSQLVDNFIDFTQVDSQGAPVSGETRLFSKSDGKLYINPYGGAEIVLGGSGESGYSGYSGTSGMSGTSGLSGYSGLSGTSGISGTSGLSGYSGISGFSGDSGISGYSGYSGSLSLAAIPNEHSASGLTLTFTAHENQAFGDMCFINSDGEAAIGDATGIASSSAIVMCSDLSITANNPGNYLLHGIAKDDGWAWSVGGLIYLSLTGTTGNTITQVAPSSTDEVIQILGVATHANRIYFNPQLVQVEHT